MSCSEMLGAMKLAIQTCEVWKIVAVSILAIVYTTCLIVAALRSPNARYLRCQNWVGVEKRWLATLHGRIASIKRTRQNVLDGYYRFSKQNQAFVIPMFGRDALMVLPPGKVRDYLRYPDSEVDITTILKENIAARWTGDNDLSDIPLHLDIVRSQLTRKLPQLCAQMNAELIFGFEHEWAAAVENEWTDIPAWHSCMAIVSRAANRVFCGQELCRDQDFLRHSRMYAQSIFSVGGMISLIPWVLRPIVAPLVALSIRKHLQICRKHTMPIIESRLRRMRSGDKTSAGDALDWLIQEAAGCGSAVELDADRLCRRLLRLNMVAIHTTGTTVTNVVLDLFGSPNAAQTVDRLRRECEQVGSRHKQQWTSTALQELVHLESVIRESMRLSSLGVVGCARMVAKPEGIDLSDGIHIPRGIRIAAPNAAIHYDAALYDQPDVFYPFRFVHEGNITTPATQTSEVFLVFGHGRHACPGRMFAVQEMKLMLVHMLTEYDVCLPGARPASADMGAASVPAVNAKIKIRRRVAKREED